MCSCRNGRDVTGTNLPFARVILEDFEFISRPGERPDVVCRVFHDLSTGQTTRLWRDQLGEQPPYDTGPIRWSSASCSTPKAHATWRSAGRYLKNVLDLSAEFKCQVNGKGIPRKNQGLIGALQYFGLSSIAPKRKDAMRDRIMQGLAVHRRGARADPRLLRRGRRGAAQAAVRDAAEDRSSPRPASRRSGRRPGALGARRRADRHGDLTRSSPTRRPGARSATAWCRWSTCTASTSTTRTAWHWNNARFEQWTASEGIAMAAQGRHRQARPAAQDLREHGQGLSGGRAAAAAALHPRQAAHHPAERRARQPKQHGAVAVLVEDLAHAAEGQALDLLAVGVAALPDPPGARQGARLHRLFEHGIPGGGGAVGRALRPRQPDARALP